MSDLDIPLEDEEQSEERVSYTRFVPWLIIVALGLLFLPLYFGSAAIQDNTGPLSTQLAGIRATLTAPPKVPDAEQTLSIQALSMRGQLDSIVAIPPTLAAGHIDWPGIMTALHEYDSNQIRLTGFVNNAMSLTLTGNAVDESAVLAYVATLQQTSFFSQVRVQTITVSSLPSPTPNLTPSARASALAPIYMPFDFNLSIDLAEGGSGSR